MGLLDKLGGMFGGRRVDIELRFERVRSAISGTMSNFFVAKDRDHDNRLVGVKLCDIEKVEFFESRFKGLNKPSEGEIASAMKHVNIAETYEFGDTNRGQPYLVMEFIDGPGVQVVIQQPEKFPVRGKCLPLIRQMAEALEYVHRSGYIHRDICPRNYICSEDLSRVKLIDFGLTVPATGPFMQPGNRTGTPLYMSPEVVRRRSTDQRLDIFSFGVTCYHLICLDLPWPVTETSGIAALRHDTSAPTPMKKFRPAIHPKLEQLIMHAMAPKVEERLPSMKDFLRGLDKIDTEEISA